MPTATFLGLDVSTGGNWKGVYGEEGYYKQEVTPGNVVQSLPSWLNSVTPSGVSGTFDFGVGSDPTTALERAASTDRDRIVWYVVRPESMTFSLEITDSVPHLVHAYIGYNANFATIEIVDPVDSAVLSSFATSGDDGSRYAPFWLSWEVAGAVGLRLTSLVGGDNIPFSGLFFDSPSPTSPFRPEWASRVNTLIGG